MQDSTASKKNTKLILTLTDIAVGTVSCFSLINLLSLSLDSYFSWISFRFHQNSDVDLFFIIQLCVAIFETNHQKGRIFHTLQGQGISSPLLGSIFTGSIFFSSYEFAKREFAVLLLRKIFIISQRFNGQSYQSFLPLYQVFLSGSLAVRHIIAVSTQDLGRHGRLSQHPIGIRQNPDLSIISEINSLQVKNLQSKCPQQRTWSDTNAYQTNQTKRIRIYLSSKSGMSMQLMRNFFGVGTFFTAHDCVLRYCTPPGQTRREVSQFGMMMAGVAAGFSFWTVAYPVDILKTKIQGDDIEKPKHEKVFGYVKDLYREGGLRQFYKGYQVSVLRSMYTNFIQLYVYENLHLQAYRYYQIE